MTLGSLASTRLIAGPSRTRWLEWYLVVSLEVQHCVHIPLSGLCSEPAHSNCFFGVGYVWQHDSFVFTHMWDQMLTMRIMRCAFLVTMWLVSVHMAVH